jgi:hypothetical protein
MVISNSRTIVMCALCDRRFVRAVGDPYIPPHRQRDNPAVPCIGFLGTPIERIRLTTPPPAAPRSERAARSLPPRE